MVKTAAISLLLTVFCLSLAEAQTPFSGVLVSSRGDEVDLARFSGKPVILFYEDRHSSQLNKPLKNRLLQWGKERQLLDAAHVVAVANLRSLNFFPIKNVALRRVRGIEERVGFPILVDLEGTLSAPPLSLPPESSTVVVLDEAGAVRYQRTGALSEAEIGQVVATLDTLLLHR